MTAFPDWKKYVVPQRRVQTGCIPTGYEILTRAAGIKDIDLSLFQDDFDLDKNKNFNAGDKPENNFISVASAVSNRYPDLIFKCVSFETGAEKVSFIDEQIGLHHPVLISLSMVLLNVAGWHIMPVVDADAETFTLLLMMDHNGKLNLMKLSKQLIIETHDRFDGGKDVAFLSLKSVDEQ